MSDDIGKEKEEEDEGREGGGKTAVGLIALWLFVGIFAARARQVGSGLSTR